MKKNNVFSFIGNIVFYMVIVFLIFICVVMLTSKIKGEQPTIFGYKFFSVLTGSMSPTIDPGDLIIVKEIKSENIKVEDIITFGSSTNNITTHRVKEIVNEDGIKFITKGDGNNATDPVPISEKLLVGKVVYWVPKAGSAIVGIKDNMIVVIGIVSIIILASVYWMGSDKLSKKRENDKSN